MSTRTRKFVFVKKNLRFHKFPDTCGRGLKLRRQKLLQIDIEKCYLETQTSPELAVVPVVPERYRN